MTKKITFISSIIGFFAGTYFVMSQDADITANVIGASGSGSATTAIAGLALIIASMGLFILGISLEDAVGKYAKSTKTPSTAYTPTDHIKETEVKSDEYTPKHEHK